MLSKQVDSGTQHCWNLNRQPSPICGRSLALSPMACTASQATTLMYRGMQLGSHVANRCSGYSACLAVKQRRQDRQRPRLLGDLLCSALAGCDLDVTRLLLPQPCPCYNSYYWRQMGRELTIISSGSRHAPTPPTTTVRIELEHTGCGTRFACFGATDYPYRPILTLTQLFSCHSMQVPTAAPRESG